MKKTRKLSKNSLRTSKVPKDFGPQELEDPDDSSWGVVGGIRNPHKKPRKLHGKSPPNTGNDDPWKPQIIDMNETEPYGAIAFVGGVRNPNPKRPPQKKLKGS